MGFFRKVGRRVERFKSEVETVAEEQASHACAACGERFYTAHEPCPECGAEAVERIAPDAPEADDEPSTDPEAADDTPAADAADSHEE